MLNAKEQRKARGENRFEYNADIFVKSSEIPTSRYHPSESSISGQGTTDLSSNTVICTKNKPSFSRTLFYRNIFFKISVTDFYQQVESFMVFVWAKSNFCG